MSEMFDIEPASKNAGGVLAFHGPDEFLAEGVAKAKEISGLNIHASKFFNFFPSTPPGYSVWALRSRHFKNVHSRIRLESAAKIAHIVNGFLEVAEAQNVRQGSSLRVGKFAPMPLGYKVEMEVDAPGLAAPDVIASVARGVSLGADIFGASTEMDTFARNPDRVGSGLSYGPAGINFRIGSFGRLKTDANEWDPQASVFKLRGHHIQSPDHALACLAVGVSLANPQEFESSRAVA